LRLVAPATGDAAGASVSPNKRAEAGHLWAPAMALLLCLPALLPLLQPGFVEGHDGVEHLFRVLALETGWRNGILLPRWVPELALGFGYPFFGVYSPLSYVVPALSTLLGASPVVGVKIGVALALLTAGLGAYSAASRLAGRTAGIVAAVTYVYAPYTLANAYVRLDLAELTAMACAALGLAAVIRITHHPPRETDDSSALATMVDTPSADPMRQSNERQEQPTARSAGVPPAPVTASWRMRTRGAYVAARGQGEGGRDARAPWDAPYSRSRARLREMLPVIMQSGRVNSRPIALAAAALATLPLAHDLSVLTFLPTFAAVGIAALVTGLTRRTIRETVLPLLAALLLGGALAAFFLLPAILWQSWTKLALIPQDPAFFQKLLDVPALLQRHFAVPGWGWFGTEAGVGLWNFSVAPSRVGELGAGPSSLAWLALPAALIGWRRLPDRARAPAGALLVALAFSTLAMTTVSGPLWQVFPHLTLLQFPWRFDGPLCLDSAIVLGLVTTAIPARARAALSALLMVAALVPAGLYLRPAAVSLLPNSVTWPAQLRRELVGGYGTTGSGLFLPRWVDTPAPQGSFVTSSPSEAANLQILAMSGRAGSIDLRYSAPRPVSLTLGAWYFPSWTAQADGQEVTVRADTAGLLQVALPAGTHHLVVAQGLTWPEKVGDAVSLVGLVALAGLLAGSASWGRPRRRSRLAAVVLAAGALLALAAAALLARAGSPPVWSLPAHGAETAPLGAVAWRLEQSAPWGTRPVLEVAWLLHQTPASDQQITVALRAPNGQIVARRQQYPHFGTVHTAGLPAGMLLLDQLDLPTPLSPCAEPYEIAVGMGDAGQPAPLTTLGSARLPCGPTAPPTVARVDVASVIGLQAGRLPRLTPGAPVTLDASVLAPGPTATDDLIGLQLLSHSGTAVAGTQSYGNVDLRFSTLWQPGQRVPYHLRLAVPANLPVGLYTLSLDLFSPENGSIQAVTDASSPDTTPRPHLTVATVKVAAPRLAGADSTVRFGSDIGLLQPAHTGDQAPVLRAQSGAMLTVPLRWYALDAPPADYTVFIHLIDVAGRLVDQMDGPPLGGAYPTSVWDSQEAVDDPRTLTVPVNLPPGRYRVQAGWYLPSNGARLAVTPAAPDNAVTIAQVDVEL